MKCKCGHPNDYNYAIDNGSCNSCIAEKLEQLKAELATAKEENKRLRPFPLLSEKGICGSVFWWVAEQAYITYASKYGNEQSLERLAERGGFGISEMDEYFPEWRDKCSLITQLKAELDEAKEKNRDMKIAINIAIHLICSGDDFGGDVQKKGIEILEQLIGGE